MVETKATCVASTASARPGIHPLARPAAGILPDLSLLGVAFIWGINIPFMKLGLEQIDIFVFNAIRLAVSAVVLVGLAWLEFRRGNVFAKLNFRQVVIYALMISFLYQVLFLLGIARTTSGNTALIISTVPMWTALLARFFLGETIRRFAWIGLSIALVGTAIVAFQKGDVAAGREHLIGNFIVLLAALIWSAGTVYSRPLLKIVSPMHLAALTTTIALPLHFLLAISPMTESVSALRSISLWGIIIYAGVLSSGLALPMWHYGVRHAGAAHAAIFQNVVPLVAIIVAWLTQGEQITSAQILGGVLIVGGLIAMRISREDDGNQERGSNKTAKADIESR